MFAKFNLKLNNSDFNDDLWHYGSDLYANQEEMIHSTLDKYLNRDGFLNAAEIENDWFPAVNAQVFLSHSHRDKDMVIRFAGYLLKKYKITSFIDSVVWGYANDLLKQIDYEYCVERIKPSGNLIYDYNRRNQSTAHVHLILQGALAKMINRCEALMFVNTPNSLATSNIVDATTTASPWIYSELLMANTFPARKPEYHDIMKGLRYASMNEQAELRVKYQVGISDFVDIDLNDIKRAADGAKRIKYRSVLDQLYLDKGLIEN